MLCRKSSSNAMPGALLNVLFVCSLLFFASVSASDFKVFKTHQFARELIPVLTPLYGSQATFTAKDNSLIVKAPPSVLKEIEQLLQEIDAPAQNLLLEVSSTLDGSGNIEAHSIEGAIKAEDTRIISTAPPRNRPAASVRYKKDGTLIKTTHTRRQGFTSQPDTFKIRAATGHWAQIQTGQKVPYYSADYPYADKRYPLLGGSSVEFQDVTSGFEVFPTLNGDTVTLKVRPYHSSMNRAWPDRINQRSLETVVTGKLGQWIYLGGAMNQINTQNNGYTHSTRRFTELDTAYRIRVNKID